MTTELGTKSCKPCSAGTPSLSSEEANKLLKQLESWKIAGNKLQKSISFDDFMGPLNLANEIAKEAEKQDHHPDLTITFGELKIELWTHKINGLSENDFILASKIDKIVKA